MREITGRKVLIFTVGAFSIIIVVNLFMASQALRTFPGLEVRNSYVASQNFDAERAAQEALGWSVGVDYVDGVLTLAFTEEDGTPADVAAFTALVGRPTTTRDDVTPEFTLSKGVFSTPVDLAQGSWTIRVRAEARDETAFKQRIPLFVSQSQARE